MVDQVEESGRRDRYQVTAPEGQTIFPVSFPVRVMKDKDGVDYFPLSVFVDGVEIDDAVFNADTSNVVLGIAADQGAIVVIEGNQLVKRISGYPLSGALRSQLLNLDMNTVVQILQELKRDLSRCFSVSKSEGDSLSKIFPDILPGHILKWGPNGIENGPDTTDLSAVAQHLDQIDQLAAIDGAVVNVAGIAPAVSSVAANQTPINGVFGNLTMLNAIYGALTSIGVVAAAIDAVQSAYANIAAIIAAPGAASNAANSAALAQSWAVDNIGARPEGSAAYWAAQAALYGGSVKVTAADTTPAVLNSKLTVGTGLTKSTVNPAANEQLNIAVDFAQVATAAQGAKADAALTGTAMAGRILSGLKMSNGTDTVNDINIAAGVCISDDGTTVMTLAAITKQLDALWAAGTNAGGRDTGSIADGTWHVWGITRTDTGVTDILFSLSATAPTMPANYTKKKRIGSIIRASGGILQFVQTGNKFRLKALKNDLSATAQNNVSRDTRTLSVPVGIVVEAEVSLQYDCPASSNYGVLVTDLLNEADTAVTLTNATMYIGGNGGYQQGATVTCNTNTSAQIGIRASLAGGTVNISTRGWTDWGI